MLIVINIVKIKEGHPRMALRSKSSYGDVGAAPVRDRLGQ